MQNVLEQTFALVRYNSVFVGLLQLSFRTIVSPNTCKVVFNTNVTTFQSNCAEGLHFSAFHFTCRNNTNAAVMKWGILASFPGFVTLYLYIIL